MKAFVRERYGASVQPQLGLNQLFGWSVGRPVSWLAVFQHTQPHLDYWLRFGGN